MRNKSIKEVIDNTKQSVKTLFQIAESVEILKQDEEALFAGV